MSPRPGLLCLHASQSHPFRQGREGSLEIVTPLVPKDKCWRNNLILLFINVRVNYKLIKFKYINFLNFIFFVLIYNNVIMGCYRGKASESFP